ncbi:MAG: four helix bundle protein [Bacteroidales bacterium]|nr:four helix bundle protein [Bacteroidales bacterium]
MSHPWKDLIVWQKAHQFVLEIYTQTNKFPDKERFGLTQQLRRSATSIAANIVEGKSKNTDKEFVSFLYNSRGSLEETRYHLLLARDLGYIDEKEYESSEKMAIEISYLLNKLISSILK